MKHSTYEFRIRRYKRSYAAEAAVRVEHTNTISSSNQAARLFRHLTKHADREYFFTAFVDVKSILIGYEVIHIGAMSGVDVYPPQVFRGAILAGAAGVIVGHNHPSGDVTPSDDDVALTARLGDVGKLIGIPLLDHVIVGDGEHYSFHKTQIIK